MKVQVIRSNRKTIGLEVRADESVICGRLSGFPKKNWMNGLGSMPIGLKKK